MKPVGIRSLLAPLLTLALLISLTTPAFARETAWFTRFPQEVNLASLTPGKPDSAPFEAKAAQLERAMAQTDNADQVQVLLEEWLSLYEQFETEYSVFNYAYTCDAAAYSGDYLAWANAALLLESCFTQQMRDLIASPYRAVVVAVLGEESVAYLSSEEPNAPEEIVLLNRHAELVNTYWSLISKKHTVTYNGVAYTEEMLSASDSDTIDEDTYTRLLLELAKQSNAEVGPIFLEIVQVLNRYAVLKGFENYGELAYRDYGRDYSMADAAAFHHLVREYFVPLCTRQQALAYVSPAEQASGDACAALFEDADQADLVDMVRPHMNSISSEFAQLFDYMLRCNLLDIEPNPKKNTMVFTSPLPSYDSAYICGYHYGTSYDVSALVHEFGHFAEFCFAENAYAGMSLDLAEVNSQGLEVLYYPYATEMVGEEAALSYRNGSLSNLLYAVTEGALMDEFLQTVYTTPQLTLEQVNRIYHDIAESYGQMMADDTYGYSWSSIPHHFEAPFYYLSYATSAMASLDLLARSATDYDAACDTYLRLTSQGIPAQNGFRAALVQAGLDDVFEEETVSFISSAIEDYLYDSIYQVDFPDLEQSWARENALFCTAAGLFEGDGGFRPEAALTRAQAVALLWRLCGAPDAATSGAFSDVAQDAWYAQAADWCAENGILGEVSHGNAVFAPDTLLSRQELIVLLYRVCAADDAESRTVPRSFTDADAVAPWAVDGVAWAVESGIVHGKADGTLAPDAPVTRAEAATLLANCLA